VPASATTTTNSQGNFTLSNLPGKTYDVVVTASGYNANHVANVLVTNNTTATSNSALAGIPGNTTMDNFTQPNQNGWSPSTDGSTFSDDANVYPGATLSIQNNTGYADTYTAATDRDEWFGPATTDQLVSGDFNVSQFGQDAYQHGARLLGRITDDNNFIDFAVNYATNTLQIWDNSNNNWTMLSQVNVSPFKTNQWYHSKLLTVGTTSYGKVWAYGTAEPAWQISGSQTDLTAGGGGFRSTYAFINWANIKVQAVTTITGTVKSASKGTAIAGATVSDGTNSTTTDSSGRYILIEPNKNATYTVTASASGFSTKSSAATTTSLKSTTLNFSL
ncbi:MAG TPA: carboxypeptidase regulatory-like domain-containing protein, partial [Ktedonobacterales bacterium]|nr:carboxypeptidase regulatory-like domain-containing protein [Ktedonobacterales bacterium]